MNSTNPSIRRKGHFSPSFLRGTITIGLCLLAVGMGTRSQAGNAKTAQQAFKNVQVLKDVPADDLVPGMQFVAASLGVECDFCHIRDAFEKDDKKTKQTARRMMQMVLNINQLNFQGSRKVTCYTCHRGSHTPLGTPMVEDSVPHLADAESSGDASSEEDVGDRSLPTPKDILDRFVASLGGTAAIEKVSSRSERGVVAFGGGSPVPIEIVIKTPSKQRMTVHLAAGDSITAFDGETGWTRAPGSPVREMHQAEFEGARLDADLQFGTHVQTLFTHLKVLKVERVGDRDAFLVLASKEKQEPLELYFDRES